MSSSNKDILVSFIVPVFNTGEWLYETLDSINNQTFDLSKVQVIIINDCSTDPYTNSLIADLKKTNTYKNLNLDIIENPKNMWLSRTRNIGVKQAKGEYVVFVDDDDAQPANTEVNALVDTLKSETQFMIHETKSKITPNVDICTA